MVSHGDAHRVVVVLRGRPDASRQRQHDGRAARTGPSAAHHPAAWPSRSACSGGGHARRSCRRAGRSGDDQGDEDAAQPDIDHVRRRPVVAAAPGGSVSALFGEPPPVLSARVIARLRTSAASMALMTDCVFAHLASTSPNLELRFHSRPALPHLRAAPSASAEAHLQAAPAWPAAWSGR